MQTRIDETDQQIIACLQESGRQTNTDIAGKLGLSESTVRKRIDRLLSDGTIKIVGVADPLKLGYSVVAIIGIQCLPSRLREVESAVGQLEEFRFIGLTTGAYDFVAEAWFRSVGDLQRFLTEKLAPIEGIQRIETNHVLKMIRYAYDWGQRAGMGADGDGGQASGPGS